MLATPHRKGKGSKGSRKVAKGHGKAAAPARLISSRTTMAVCPAGHVLVCVSGSRCVGGFMVSSFMCDAASAAECCTVIDQTVERWGCAVCDHDVCDECEPTEAVAAAAAKVAGDAALAAALARRVIDAALAEEQRRAEHDVVRVKLRPRLFRAARDWGGGTWRGEWRWGDALSPDVHDKLVVERGKRAAAEAGLSAERCAREEGQRAREEATRQRVAAERIAESLRVQLDAAQGRGDADSGCSECATYKRLRRSAEGKAEAAMAEAEASQAAMETARKAAAEARAAEAAAMAAARVAAQEAAAKVVKREEAKIKAAKDRAGEAARQATGMKREREAAEKRAATAEAKAAAAEVREGKAKQEVERLEHECEQQSARAQAWEQRLRELRATLGIDENRNVPSADDRRHGLPLLKAAIANRPAADVATALKLAGGTQLLSDLAACHEFQPVVKKTIDETVAKIQERWSPRLAVLLMSDLQLSRSQFEALRHYLSFAYDVDDDVYRKLMLYVNPFNEREKVAFPSLAPRSQWEPERAALFAKCGVTSSDDGMVSYVKDQRAAVAQMTADHWAGISEDVKEGRRAMLVAAFGDATGGWRGSSITHFELAICSWEDKDIKQCSKSNLLPAALAEGDDGAESLRIRFQSVADGFDALASGVPLDVELSTGRRIQVPIDFTFCGDFQIHKAILGMSTYTSAIFCGCDKDTTGMFNFKPLPATSWSDCESWFKEIGCEVKTDELVCELNHDSYEDYCGRPFKRFKCSQPGCGYEAKTVEQWRADKSAHFNRESEARKEADREHGRLHKRHRLFMRKMMKKTPVKRMSVDILHILFINYFQLFFEATILCYVVEMSEVARKPIEVYLASKQIHVKLVKAKDMSEMKDSLIGRDAKVLMDRCEEIIPELLCFVHAPKPQVEAAAADAEAEVAQGAGLDDDEFTWDGDGDADAADAASLESNVASKIAGASVQRVAAAEQKGALLDRCVALTRANMREYCSEAELRAKRADIAASDVIAINVGTELLAFAAYRTREPEGTAVVTYLFELHRNLSDERASGLGSLLEAEVVAAAAEAGESVMLTVAEKNAKARRFYANRDYWIDTSSPQHHGSSASYVIMRKYPSEDETVAERDARFWDHFYAVVRAFRVFESDTNNYREQRAVEVFNAASQLGRDAKVLRPTLVSACPHILANVVPRQIVDLGDPLRRGCDQSEAVGANMKSTIHRRVVRRTITNKSTKHTRRDAKGAIVKQWTQKALKVSRVMQAFRAECVRERILRDPGSAHLLQRKHCKLINMGRVSTPRAKEETPDTREITAAYAKRVRELRDEGGEPGM